MRKLLLASVAMLSGSLGLAGVASAQLQTQYPYTPPAGSTPVSGPVGSPTSPAVQTVIPQVATLPPLSTGSLTVRLGGRLTTYFGAFVDSGRNPGGILQTAGYYKNSDTYVKPSITPVSAKSAPYAMAEYARLYPSFDGVAANGLKYGAFLEIRQENYAAPGSSGANSIYYETTQRGSLYFKRETAYIGTDSAGFLRMGATDQPTSLFIVGTFENFDEGGWNLQSYPSQFSYNAIPVWPFPDTGNLYTSSKIVYVSPKFGDLVDFGISFSPNDGNVGAVGGACPYAVPGGTSVSGTGPGGLTGYGCDALSSSSSATDAKRTRNIIDAVARLRTTVGPVGIAYTIGGMHSGAVAYNGSAAPSGPYQGTYATDGLSVLDSGLGVTFGGLTVGGHIDYGTFNNGYIAAPQGGIDSLAWIGGASYAFGSLIVGASYFNFQSPGNWSSPTVNPVTGAGSVGRTQDQSGAAAGASLALAPGAWAWVSYLYGQRHQAGVDLLANATPGSSNNYRPYESHNNVQAQALMVGTTFKW